MRTTVPPAFNMTFQGPEGPYTIKFKPTDDWEGVIEVSIRGADMRWDVVGADREQTGALRLGGVTSGSESVWNDRFWFELRLDDKPPVIRYWRDKAKWREDAAT